MPGGGEQRRPRPKLSCSIVDEEEEDTCSRLSGPHVSL